MSERMTRQELDEALKLYGKSRYSSMTADYIAASKVIPKLVEEVLAWRREWAEQHRRFCCVEWPHDECRQADAILSEESRV